MFNIGFEIEGITGLNRDVLTNILRDQGYVFTDSWGERTDYRKWVMTSDCSIRAGYDTGFELVSPVMPIKQGLRTLRKTFKVLKANGCKTNQSTGFHVGISFVDQDMNSRIDRKVMVFHAQELDLLEIWGRSNNHWCGSHIREMLYDRIQIAKNDPDVVHGLRNPELNKGYSFNFGHLDGTNKYVECRIMGGSNYLNRYRDALMTIKTVCRAMIESVQPGAKVDPMTVVAAADWLLEHPADY